LLVSQLARTGGLEALLRTTVRFHLRHLVLLVLRR
jgi:hypothetical protein